MWVTPTSFFAAALFALSVSAVGCAAPTDTAEDTVNNGDSEDSEVAAGKMVVVTTADKGKTITFVIGSMLIHEKRINGGFVEATDE